MKLDPCRGSPEDKERQTFSKREKVITTENPRASYQGGASGPNPLCKNLLSNDGWDTFKHLFDSKHVGGDTGKGKDFLLVSAAAPLFRGGEGHPETLCPSHATSLHIWTLGPAGPVPPPSTSCGSPGSLRCCLCLPSTAK